MDKFSSKVHRVHMELGGKLLNSLRIETQFLERFKSVIVVDGAAHTQKDDVESNGNSLENVAKVFVLFLCGIQLVLRSGVLTVLDLDNVDVTPMFAEVFRSHYAYLTVLINRAVLYDCIFYRFEAIFGLFRQISACKRPRCEVSMPLYSILITYGLSRREGNIF